MSIGVQSFWRVRPGKGTIFDWHLFDAKDAIAPSQPFYPGRITANPAVTVE
jgi:hypothetical protein